MNPDYIALLIPVSYAFTEAYKLFINKSPISGKVKAWMEASIPLFAIVNAILFSLLIFGFQANAVLNGVVAGLSAIGLYDGIKYSATSVRAIK